MGKECIDLIKDIGIYDLIIGGVISLILIPFFGGGAGLFYLGLGCSFINFIINSYANHRIISTKNIFHEFLIIISYVIRGGFICSIAMLLIIKKDLFFFIFIAGYSAQLISIVIYGLRLNTREEV